MRKEKLMEYAHIAGEKKLFLDILCARNVENRTRKDVRNAMTKRKIKGYAHVVTRSHRLRVKQCAENVLRKC